MNIAHLSREITSDDGTFGTLTIINSGRHFSCVTAELPFYGGDKDKHNERQKDCIPAGEYVCSIVRSQKFGSVYEVKGVPGRAAILIHAGNYAGNTAKGKRSDVLGCILLGDRTTDSKGQKIVTNSKITLKEFMDVMNGQDFKLVITDNF